VTPALCAGASWLAVAVQEAMDIMQSDQLKIVADSEAVGVYGKHSKLSLAASQVALANTQQGTSA